MGKPVICYKNILRNDGATITASSTAAGFQVASCYDYRSYTLWKASSASDPQYIDIDLGIGGAVKADYVLIVNHNLQSAGGVDVRVLSGSVHPPATTEVLIDASLQPGVLYGSFTETAQLRYWRINLQGITTAPFLGQVFLGLKTELPHYLSSDFQPFMRQVEVSSARSQGGHYLGASLRGQQHRGVISFGRAGAARGEFTAGAGLLGFINNHAALRRPFGFVVDPDDISFDTPFYVKVPDEETIDVRAVGKSWSSLTFDLPVEEAWAESAE